MKSRKRFVAAALAAAAGLVALLHAPRAEACGGCFGEQPSVVTDHRMVLSVSQSQTTLYDQIQYTGDPKSFAWVLPIVGQVDVGVSSDIMFRALDQMTTTRVTPPPRNCPGFPSNCPQDASARGDAGSASAGGGVDVLKSEVVGPYETVQLRSTDPNALTTWLTDHAFAIPDDTKAIIAQYVTEHFDFLAVKLVPGKGIQSMVPISVTTMGASPVLPLRMVAAGSGASVGITLWVVSEGRYEPQNFPFFHIEDQELIWDWNANLSNYRTLRADKTQASGGKAWEIESSSSVYKSNLESQLSYQGGSDPKTGERLYGGYAAQKDAQGKVVKTSKQVFEEDMTRLFGNLPGQTVRATRMRADLSKQALSVDLLVKASADQAELPTIRQVTREANEPQCPVYSNCEVVGTAPRSEAEGNATSLAGGGCRTDGKSSAGSTAILAVGGVAVILAARARRTRTTRKNGAR